MDQKGRYEAYKTRNEEHLLSMIQLEQEIALVQQQMDIKRRSIRDLSRKEKNYHSLVQLHQKYQEQLDQKKDSSERDQLLTQSADTICTKLEMLIERQLSTGQPLSSLELTQIEHWIKRVPRDQPGHYLVQLLNQLNSLPSPPLQTPQPDPPTHPQQAQVSLLVDELKQLEKETAAVELELIQHIRSTFQNRAVQSALGMKAACLQAKTELEFNKRQLDALETQLTKSNVALASERKQTQHQIDALLDQITEKQKQVQTFIKLNQRFQTIQLPTENIAKIKESINVLRQLPYVCREAPAPIITKTMSNIECPPIVDLNEQDKEKLVELIHRWSQSLGVDVAVGKQDTVDAMIESIDCLRKHVEEKEQAYVRQQEDILKKKLKVTESIERQLDKTEQALTER
ncbi:hypothetical protein BD560DRAFT_430667 [Blakeslea trispora]|nr:hypothetical protein BD560DRAFT_430667 [Blakeslea trispora]